MKLSACGVKFSTSAASRQLYVYPVQRQDAADPMFADNVDQCQVDKQL